MDFKPRNRIFYRWWMVAAIYLSYEFTGGMIFIGFTAIFEPIAREFGWSYAQVSLAVSLRGSGTGVVAPIAGLLVGRYGPRKMVFAGAIIFGAGLLAMSRINSLATFYGSVVLIAIGMSAMASTVTLTAIAYWFKRRVALATGIVSSGFGSGGLMIPLITWLTDQYEWRTALTIMAFAVWLIVIPASLVIRHRPEPYGYLPDGDTAPPEKAQEITRRTAATPAPLTPERTMRAFWHIGIATAIHMFCVNSVVTHVMPYFTTVGIPRTTASFIAGAAALASIGGRISFGWFGDRIKPKIIGALGFAAMFLGLLAFNQAGSGWLWLLVVYIIFFSLGWGGSVTMRAVLLMKYYGSSKFGKLHGFAIGISLLGQISGAPFAGWFYDHWGSYNGVWLIYAGFAALGVLILATMPSLEEKT